MSEHERSIAELIAASRTIEDLLSNVKAGGGIKRPDGSNEDLDLLRDQFQSLPTVLDTTLDQDLDKDPDEVEESLEKALSPYMDIVRAVTSVDGFQQRLDWIVGQEYIARLKKLDQRALLKQEKDGRMANIIESATTPTGLIDAIQEAGGIRAEEEQGHFQQDLDKFREALILRPDLTADELDDREVVLPQLMRGITKTLGFRDKLAKLCMEEIASRKEELS